MTRRNSGSGQSGRRFRLAYCSEKGRRRSKRNEDRHGRAPDPRWCAPPPATSPGSTKPRPSARSAEQNRLTPSSSRSCGLSTKSRMVTTKAAAKASPQRQVGRQARQEREQDEGREAETAGSCARPFYGRSKKKAGHAEMRVPPVMSTYFAAPRPAAARRAGSS